MLNLFHVHNYKRSAGTLEYPDYFECVCGDKATEAQVTDYTETTHREIQESIGMEVRI